MEFIFVAIILAMAVVFLFVVIGEIIVPFIAGFILVTILPLAAFFKWIFSDKKVKKVRKVKEDPRDEFTVVRVANNDLRNRPVNRPTVWRRKR